MNTQPNVIQELINNSAELAEASITLEKQAAMVPQLQEQLEAANQKVASLAKEAADFSTQVREAASKTADVLIERGMRVQKEAFVNKLVENPLDIFAVLEKVAADITAPQMGAGDEHKAAEDGSDPIERFCNGN